MRSAVLNPGPRLLKTWNADVRARYHRIAGVNRAVFAEPECDLWVAIDAHAMRTIPPRWMTCNSANAELMNEGRIPPGVEATTLESFYGLIPEDLGKAPGALGWFSNMAAIVRSVLDGAKEVDVFGFDGVAGAADFDGVELDANTQHPDFRSADRFATEERVFANVVAWCAARGCEVRRVR